MTSRLIAEYSGRLINKMAEAIRVQNIAIFVRIDIIFVEVNIDIA